MPPYRFYRIIATLFLLVCCCSLLIEDLAAQDDLPDHSNTQDSPNCGDQSSLFATLSSSEATDKVLTFGKTLVHSNTTLEETFYTDPSNLLGGLVLNGHTLEYDRTNDNFLDESQEVSFYRQNVYGVPVIGGGISVIHERRVGGPDGPDGPSGPCDREIFFFRPGIVDDLSPSNPKGFDVSKSEASSLLSIPESDIESITNSYRKTSGDDCFYRLIADVKYTDEENEDPSRIAGIDIQNQTLVYENSIHFHKNAPTESFGNVNLDDRDFTINIGGGITSGSTTLSTSDGGVFTYDFGAIPIEDVLDPGPAAYNAGLIPTSPLDDNWDATHAALSAYQTHWLVDNATEIYSGLGINFGRVNAGANTTGQNAFALGQSTIAESWIVFGTTASGNTLAQMDVVAHELGHCVINELFGTNGQLGPRTLHEGISDMFGTYVEMLFEGGADWIMGDNDPDISGLVDRDLENPLDNCFTDVENFAGQHARSRPLGHWFFLVSEEGAGDIPMEDVLQIVMLALTIAPENADYEQFMEATLDAARMTYGVCSNQFLTLSNAWNQICVPTDFPVSTETFCDFAITGPSSFCEESPNQSFCISGGVNTSTGGVATPHFRYYILGRQNTEYSSSCGMQGNSQEDCSCLSLTSIPNFPYYPQKIKIVVKSVTQGYDLDLSKTVTIYDCDGDDPTCEEYYNTSGRASQPEMPVVYGVTAKDVLESRNLQEKLQGQVHLYNISGQLMFKGSHEDLKLEVGRFNSGIYFMTSFGESGSSVESYKLFLND